MANYEKFAEDVMSSSEKMNELVQMFGKASLDLLEDRKNHIAVLFWLWVSGVQSVTITKERIDEFEGRASKVGWETVVNDDGSRTLTLKVDFVSDFEGNGE